MKTIQESNELKWELVSKYAIEKCKCGKPGSIEMRRMSGPTHKTSQIYSRVIHTGGTICYLGKPRTISEVKQIMTKEERLMQPLIPKTLDEYEAFVKAVKRLAKETLDDPGRKSIRNQVLHRLFWRLPVNSHRSQEWQLQRYKLIVNDIVKEVSELDDKRYSTVGKSIKPQFVKLLKDYGFWKKEG